MKFLAIILIIVFLIVIGPIATIWALNTLFPALAIPFSFETWAAVVILGGVIRGDGLSFGSKK
jgi:hypothetical protein